MTAIFDFYKPQHPNKFIFYIIEFLDPENIPLDTKFIFLTALENMIWLLLYFVGHLGSQLGFDPS